MTAKWRDACAWDARSRIRVASSVGVARDTALGSPRETAPRRARNSSTKREVGVTHAWPGREDPRNDLTPSANNAKGVKSLRGQKWLPGWRGSPVKRERGSE